MLVEINNLSKVKIKRNWIEKFVQKIFNKIKKTKKIEELSIALVGEKEIKKINKNYRDVNRITDVLSFEGINEIIICYPRAKRQAQEKKHSVEKEIEILLIHGLLHLVGYDHQNKKEDLKMRTLEKKLLIVDC